jgi:spore germination protein GerM
MKKIHSGIIFWIVFALFLVGVIAVNYEQIRQTIVYSKLPRSLTYLFMKKSDDPLLNKSTTQEVSGELMKIAELMETVESADTAVENIEPPEQEAVPPKREEAPKETSPTPAVITAPLYFVKVDANGDLIQTAVKKDFPYTEAPLTALLNALLEGVSSEEERDGFISFIPEGTRLLSAIIQNGTAYISFNENFRYNTFGIEGYAAQIKQVLLTATEFPTVKNVQILIEGKKESYLGDGIFIGGPLNRESFR